MYMVPEELAFFEDLGLVDFCNPEDFDVKLESLKIAWNGLLASFHNWFITHRADIIRSKLVLLAQTNCLEYDHWLQKKFLAEEGQQTSECCRS